VIGPALVLGGTGLLGKALTAELARRGEAFTAPTRDELDLSVAGGARAWIERVRPAAVLNASGFTNVPACELEDNRAAVEHLNAALPAELASACAPLGTRLLHVSTDYVFDGDSTRPYREDDEVAPLQEYGRSKLRGESAVLAAYPQALVIRVSTLYGPGRPGRDAYVDAILRQARGEHEESTVLAVVEKPVSSPTYAPDVAPAALDLLERRASGIVHVVNEGAVSRLELARATVACAGLGGRVRVLSKPEPAVSLARPAYSVLGTDKLARLLGRRLPDWKDALRRYVGA
jgi:dTDP-4-dehydrorhamnose reductase